MAGNHSSELNIEPSRQSKDSPGTTSPAAAEKEAPINGMASLKNIDADLVETGSVDGTSKAYYSKLSVWLMILFSGLAIGSDG